MSWLRFGACCRTEPLSCRVGVPEAMPSPCRCCPPRRRGSTGTRCGNNRNRERRIHRPWGCPRAGRALPSPLACPRQRGTRQDTAALPAGSRASGAFFSLKFLGGCVKTRTEGSGTRHRGSPGRQRSGEGKRRVGRSRGGRTEGGGHEGTGKSAKINASLRSVM